MSSEDSNDSLDESINESISLNDFKDDSDSDLTNDPTEPSTSTCFLGRHKHTNVQNTAITPKSDLENLSSSDDEVVDRRSVVRPVISCVLCDQLAISCGQLWPLFDDLSSLEDEFIQNPTKGMPTRGCRPRVPRLIRRPQLVDPAGSSWDEVLENEDPGYQLALIMQNRMDLSTVLLLDQSR